MFQRLVHSKLTAYGFVGVFVFGLSAVILARVIHSLEHPDAYQTTIPSISGTARQGLASIVFASFMGASGVLIIYSTYVWHLFNVSCIRQTGHLTKKFITLSRCVLLIGTIAGLSVILMATVSLETSNLGHIIFSASTFTSLGVAFLFDSFVLGNWRNYKSHETHMSFRVRRITSILFALNAMFFLYLYLQKDTAPFIDRYTTQIIYVLSEHLIAVLGFSYSPLAFLEIRDSSWWSNKSW
jgi:hypothetical protein